MPRDGTKKYISHDDVDEKGKNSFFRDFGKKVLK